MKISGMIARLSQILVERGDIDVTTTEYAGVACVGVDDVQYTSVDEFGHKVNRVDIIAKDRYEE